MDTNQQCPDEVFAVPVRENGRRTTLYTETMPFNPSPGVEVVGDIVRMLPDTRTLPRPANPTRARARVALITEAVKLAAIRTPFSTENLMSCGIFSGTPSNAIACELAEQILELQEELAACKRQLGGADAAV